MREGGCIDSALQVYLDCDIRLLREQCDEFVDCFLYGFIHNHYSVNAEDCESRYSALRELGREEKISWLAQRLHTPRVFRPGHLGRQEV